MIRATAKPIQRCHHCGSNIIIENIDGEPYCLPCGRPYHDFSEYGRNGGNQTYSRYGSEHMSIIGKRGGRPRQKDLRQQPAPQAQFEGNGGRLPNRLSELKELYAAKIKEGEASLRGNWLPQEVLAE